MAEGIQHNILAEGVITETVIALLDAPLTLAWLYVSEFADVIVVCQIVWVVLEDVEQVFDKSQELWIPFRECRVSRSYPEVVIKPKRCVIAYAGCS